MVLVFMDCQFLIAIRISLTFTCLFFHDWSIIFWNSSTVWYFCFYFSILLHVPKGELYLPWQLLTCCLKRSKRVICPVFLSTLINPKSQLVLGLLNRSDRRSLLFSGFVLFSCTSSCSLMVMICCSKSISRTAPISRLLAM